MILLKQMLIFLFMMLLGYGMARKGVLDERGCKSISWLIVNIANPALVMSSSVGNTMERSEMLYTFAIAIGAYILMIVIAELLVPLFCREKKERGVYKALLVFSNMGFMGFPIMSALYGPQSLIYGAAFMIPFNLLIYTYGVTSMTGEGASLKQALKKCLNIGVISVVFTFMLVIFGLQIPDAVSQAITMLANLTGPLCMIVIGASFVGISPKELLGDYRLLIVCAIRLILMPVIGLLVIRALTDNTLLAAVSFIILATPSGSMVSMLAQEYDADYVTASKGVALTMLLSVVTMPVLFMVMGI